MPGAFYRNNSSSGKKKSDRERRIPSFLNRDEGREAEESRSASLSAKSDRNEGSVRHSGGAWTATITPSAIITASVLSLILLAFSFLCGIIIGRGTMPMPQALELQQLLPEENTEESRDEPGEAMESILPKEELRFMTSLKSDQPAGVLSDQGKTEQRAASGAAVVVQEKPKPKPEVSETKEPVVDYVLRVAAFKSADSAQTLKNDLTKAGLRARCTQTKTKRGTWHYVQVLLRGTSADFQRTKSILDDAGLHDFMILSKKTVKK